ncbi:MAG: glycosyltransferase family 2 protein [Candidatus Korobacteraceae bacterium]
MPLSIVVITFNEEAVLGRPLASVQGLVREHGGEIIVVDSGSSDRTLEIARGYGAQVFVEEWKGFAAQKNSAIAKAKCDWILSLDADEEVSPELSAWIGRLLRGEVSSAAQVNGFWIARRNHFLGRWIRHGGFWPDPKLRLFRRGHGRIADRPVHEVVEVEGATARVGDEAASLIHHSYPTLSDYIEHMNRYSSLGAKMATSRGPNGFSVMNILLRPAATFFYNYILRLGFLDGREGLLLHLYHAAYVSWKYAKAWEASRQMEN